MPEMTFTVVWPDGTVDACSSPSLVMHDHLAVGSAYTVEEFVRRCETGLTVAGERVLEKFGFECTSAIASQGRIRAMAARYAPEGQVRVLRMHPDLPVVSAAGSEQETA